MTRGFLHFGGQPVFKLRVRYLIEASALAISGFAINFLVLHLLPSSDYSALTVAAALTGISILKNLYLRNFFHVRNKKRYKTKVSKAEELRKDN